MNRRRMWDDLRNERLSDPEARQGYLSAMRAFQLGAEVRRLRTERGLSQAQLADRIGVSQSVVARLEAGGVEPRLSTLDRVAEALGAELTVHFTVRAAEEQAIS